MGIVTKTGDHGTTKLMYQRSVSKCHPRIEACGAIDELNAALGLARANLSTEWLARDILQIQQELIYMMGELATVPEDLPRYIQEGFPRLTSKMTGWLEDRLNEIERQVPPTKGWALPGATLLSAPLDLARAVCRRGERSVCALNDAGELHNPEMVVYLNRLSDFLWVCARWVDWQAKAGNGGNLV